MTASGRLDYAQADGAAPDAFLKTEQGTACCELKGVVEPVPKSSAKAWALACARRIRL